MTHAPITTRRKAQNPPVTDPMELRLSLLSIWAPLLSLTMLVLVFGDHGLRDHLCQNVLAPAMGVSTKACNIYSPT